MPIALTIAGSDSGGGAGIQADLETFAALGVYGTSAITAITAQNTIGVTAVQALSADLVTAQIEAVAGDMKLDAVKTGMLASSAIVEAVAAAISALDLPSVVVDPVMIAKSGDRLFDQEALAALRSELLPRARVVTPNVPEAEVIANLRITSLDEAREAARRIHKLGAAAVVVKGGHLPGDEAIDLLFDGRAFTEYRARASIPATRTAPAAPSPRRSPPTSRSARRCRRRSGSRRRYVTGAIRHGLPIGQGHGPLNHFWAV